MNIGTLKQLSYTRDNVGNITAINDILDSSKTKTYQYDALYRLTQATGLGGRLAMDNDGVGNRLIENSSAGQTNYSYTANKLISSTGAKSFNFAYDNNGNTITENQKTYIYNQNQRLIKAIEGDKTLGEYLYNPNGQRVKKIADGRTTYFIFDQSGNMIGEYDESGQVDSDYIYLGAFPIARVDEWWEGMNTKLQLTRISFPGDKQLTVSWNANQEPVDGYKVHWGTERQLYKYCKCGKSYIIHHNRTHKWNHVLRCIKAYANISRLLYYHTDHLGTPILMTNNSVALLYSFVETCSPLVKEI